MGYSSDSKGGGLTGPTKRTTKLQKRAIKRGHFNTLIDDLRQELLGGANESYAGKVPQADVLRMALTYLEHRKNVIDDQPLPPNGELSFYGSMVPLSAVGDAVILIGSDTRIIQAALLKSDPPSGDRFGVSTELEGMAVLECVAKEDRQQFGLHIARALGGPQSLAGQQVIFDCTMQNLLEPGDRGKFNFSARALLLPTGTYLLLVGRHIPGPGSLLPMSPPPTRTSSLQCNWTIYRCDASILYAFSCSPNQTMYGFPISHLMSQQIYHVIHPEDTQSIANVHRDMHEYRQTAFFVGRLQHASGRYVQVLQSSIPCINKYTGELQYYLAYSLHAEPNPRFDPPARSHLSRVTGGSGLNVDGAEELVALCQRMSLETEPESLRMARSFEEAEEALVLAQHTQLSRALGSTPKTAEISGALSEYAREDMVMHALDSQSQYHGTPTTPAMQRTDESVIGRFMQPFTPLLSGDLEPPIANTVKSEISQSHAMLGSGRQSFFEDGNLQEYRKEMGPSFSTNQPGYPDTAQSNTLVNTIFGQRASPDSGPPANFGAPCLPDMESGQSFPHTPFSMAPSIHSPQDQATYSYSSFLYTNKNAFLPPQELAPPIKTDDAPWFRPHDEAPANQNAENVHSALLQHLESILGLGGPREGDGRQK